MGEGIGVLRDLVPLPHARRRLRVERPGPDVGARPPVRAGPLPRARRRRRGCRLTDGRLPAEARVVDRRRPDHRRRGGVSEPAPGVADPPPRHQPAQGPEAARRRGGRRVPGAPRGADRRGLPLHVPVPRRGRRGPPRPADRRAARPAARCAGCGAPTCGTSCWSCRRARGSTTSSRSGAATTSSGSTTRSTPSSPTARSAPRRSASAHGYETPEWTMPDPDARQGDLVRDDRSAAARCAATAR